jgi:hypothetical protein
VLGRRPVRDDRDAGGQRRGHQLAEQPSCAQAVGTAACISSVFAQVSAVKHLLCHDHKLGLDESGHATTYFVGRRTASSRMQGGRRRTPCSDPPSDIKCLVMIVRGQKKYIKLHVCSSAAKALRIARIREPASSFLFHHCPSLTYRGRGELHTSPIREFHGRYAMILRGEVKLR